ncbi:tetraspanin-32 isoform X2 [Molossus molossus]|uniref:tetraspanin-32 isoform X2 n=1 Tax=Molossus molossus TaxID=27622 RepID=UPI0017468222|nr:tetraspanin-32 isoform X2 [Molossus molossus]
MGPWSRVRMAKCQMLVTSFFVLLLGLLVATLAALTYFGAHFAVISRVSPEGSPFKAMHHWAFFTEISLAGLLTLGAVLSAAATVREAGGLMAGGFLCFALVFCALVQVAFWRLRNPTQELRLVEGGGASGRPSAAWAGPLRGLHGNPLVQMEDALLDTFDLVYEQALRSSSGARWQELVAIQDTFLCCGKSSPPSLPGLAEADLCPGEEAGTQVYAMLLSSFLRFAIHSGRSLDRRGTYALSPRAHGCQPQEPSFFRPSRGSPALLHRDDLLGPGGLSGGPRRLEDLCSCRRPAPETRHRPGPAPLARRPGGRAVPSAARGLPCLEEKPHHTSAMPCAWADTWGAVFEKFCLPHLVPLDIQTTWRMSPNCLQGFASFAEDPQP